MLTLTHATPKYRLHRTSGQAVVTIARQDHCHVPRGMLVAA